VGTRSGLSVTTRSNAAQCLVDQARAHHVPEQQDAGEFGTVPAAMDEIRGLRAEASSDLDLFD